MFFQVEEDLKTFRYKNYNFYPKSPLMFKSFNRRLDKMYKAIVQEEGKPDVIHAHSNLWAGIQAAQLLAVDADGATLSTAAEGEFRTEGGKRVQIASALDEAIALATKLCDMVLYDVPNLRLGYVRVDVYSTFAGPDGAPTQKLILTTTADRGVADELTWDALTPAELLGRFDTRYDRGLTGQAQPIDLPPVPGRPPRPTDEAAAQFAAEQARGAR
jgi:hypothetical protein